MKLYVWKNRDVLAPAYAITGGFAVVLAESEEEARAAVVADVAAAEPGKWPGGYAACYGLAGPPDYVLDPTTLTKPWCLWGEGYS